MINRGDYMKYSSFCAANSGEGFISFFDTLLDEKKYRVYYIKGGPGSGKSTLMRQIAEQTENAELIYCSGDPASLDGIILPEQQAVVIDATSPHSHEPRYPGVGGNIINLGEGWAPERLNKETIIALSEQKSGIYKSCYALLKSAKSIHQAVFAPLADHVSFSKMQVLANKILRQHALWENRERPAKIDKRFFSGISPDGRITYSDSLEKLGENVIVLEDRWMIGDLFLSVLEKKLTDNGIDHINGYHPLLGYSAIQHLIVPEARLSILSRDGIFPLDINEERVIKKISMQNLIDRAYLDQHKNKLSFIKRLEREILNLASEKLEEARDIHMKIEQEYAKGTDFEATAPLKQKLINNLFGQT